jgi:GTPase
LTPWDEDGHADAGNRPSSGPEPAVLVGVALAGHDLSEAEASLEELEQLAETAGADSVATLLQRRDKPDPATYVGGGKARAVKETAGEHDAKIVIFDDDLSPGQQRNLEELIDRRVVDRTTLILDIFAQRASSAEGKVQVELAQLRYQLPRLRGKWTYFSRLGGGIGTRGPGEAQLEVDRRRVRNRITRLERQLAHLDRGRATKRRARLESEVLRLALVGYTNAGKSTLLNTLTHADVITEDRLFSTLDPTTRRLALPGGQPVLVSDTVGFVRKLPHGLVEAFKSTLEEVSSADLLVHLVDASSPNPSAEITAVRQILAEIGAAHVPELLVLNKRDEVEPAALEIRSVATGAGVCISAMTGEGIPELLCEIESRLGSLLVELELLIPFTDGDVVSRAYALGEVLEVCHEARGTRLRVRMPRGPAGRFRRFSV